MSIVAALHWNKSPRCYISTLIFDEETMEILSSPKIQFFSKNYFSFRFQVKKMLKEFFSQIIKLHAKIKKPVKIEYRILFDVGYVQYIVPAKESVFVVKVFRAYIKKTKQLIRTLKVQPQLRKKLSGKSLKLFKRELRSLYLVSRKRDTGYEYHLWAIALHATTATYAKILRGIRQKVIDAAVWNTVA